ncbi:MAG: GNAT family N-acetyltransferase [Alphaproteobacteria bacterium]|nr:MAG: GNAT family N-acetyltransferase [Alphaproteobacteria bacterium]
MKTFQIQWLSDRPDLAGATAALLLEVWPDYYGPGGVGDPLAAAREGCDPSGLPHICAAVAEDGEVMATCALKTSSIPSHQHLTPWLAGLATREAFRKQGLGEALIAATEDKARALGLQELYCATYNAIGIVERRGWQRIDEELEDGTLYGIYILKL